MGEALSDIHVKGADGKKSARDPLLRNVFGFLDLTDQFSLADVDVFGVIDWVVVSVHEHANFSQRHP